MKKIICSSFCCATIILIWPFYWYLNLYCVWVKHLKIPQFTCPGFQKKHCFAFFNIVKNEFQICLQFLKYWLNRVSQIESVLKIIANNKKMISWFQQQNLQCLSLGAQGWRQNFANSNIRYDICKELSGAFNIDQAISQPESLEVPLLAANVQWV